MPPQKRKRLDDEEEEFDAAPGRQILPVANLPEDFSEEPADGMQYLFTVRANDIPLRRDARKLPHVTRVDNPYKTVPNSLPPPRNYDLPQTHPLLPSKEWRKVYETHFRNFRKNIHQPTIGVYIPLTIKIMPDKKERDLWWAFLAGKPESEWNPPKLHKVPKIRLPRGMRAFSPDPNPSLLPSQRELDTQEEDFLEEEEETWHVTDDGDVERIEEADMVTPSDSLTGEAESEEAILVPREPIPSLLRHIDERMSLHLLMYFGHWLQLHLSLKDSTSLTQTHARWIFALMARVDEHLAADDINLLRNLARGCLTLLNSLLRGEATVPVRDAMDVRSCWIIIATVADIWGQRDLWIDAEDMLQALPVLTSSV